MSNTLSPRQIALAARMCLIGSEPEAIAVALQTSVEAINDLMLNNPDVVAGIEARKEIVASRLPPVVVVKPKKKPRAPVKAYPAMQEAEAAIAQRPHTIAELKRIIVQRYEIDLAGIEGRASLKGIVAARDAAICAAKILWPHLTTGQIGQHFGGRAHGAIHHILSKHNLPTTAEKQNQAA